MNNRMNRNYYSQFALALLLQALLGPMGGARAEVSSQVAANNRTPIDLGFADFFVSPIGDRGLEFTDKLRTLDASRVRITGYVVEQDKPLRNVFLLTASPRRVHEEHYGLADDLPAATLHVIMRLGQERPEPGKSVSVTGILSVGNREEADGRISTVRLLLDQQKFKPNTKKARVGKGAELLRS